ncbi:MAG: PEPxxWA-CTERM sorting domain-containing protein [Sphingomonas sp.]
MRYLPAMLMLLVATPALSAPEPSRSASATIDRVVTTAHASAQPLTRAVLAPVPEPALWSTMIAGIGFAGAALRRSTRRQKGRTSNIS